jgi:hypothetical protein
MSPHTAGPWRKPKLTMVKPDTIYIADPTGNFDICTINTAHCPLGDAEANANLIWVAPELLKGLEDLLARYRSAIKLHDPNHNTELTSRIHNLIAKAKGGE